MKTLTKNSLIVLLFIVAIGSLNAQTIWVANNNPGASGGPNVTTTLQAAIDAAAASGDIIHVVPSSVSYGNVSIGAKSVSIFGIGTNVTKEGAPRSSTGHIYLNNGAHDIVLSGLRTASIYLANGDNFSVDGILIENCYIIYDILSNQSGWGATYVSNITIRSNVIGSGSNGQDRIALGYGTYNCVAANVAITNNIIVSNNHINESGINMGSNLGAVITNNLFYSSGGTDAYAFQSINSATIKNNIFYKVKPYGNVTTSNNTFSHNITFGSANDTIPEGTNSLTLNQINVDPEFINVPVGGSTTWSFANDAHITVGSSPAEGAGDDTFDIGLTGGNIPFNFEGTNLPLIQQVNIPSAIIQGSTLPTTIKAVGN